MKNLKLLSIFTLLIVMCLIAHGQGETRVHFGPSFPMGDFSDNDTHDENAGLAGTGFGIGLNYIFKVNDKGLGIFSGLDLIINPLSKDAQDDIKGGRTSNFTFPKYINIPVSAGFDYKYTANENLALFAQVGVSLTLLKMTDFLWEEQGDDDYKEKYDLSPALGFTISGGFIINRNVEIGIKYLGLGQHEIKGEYEYGDASGDINEFDQKVSVLSLTLGFRF